MKTHPTAILPTRAKPGDSGLDLYALLPMEDLWIGAGCRERVLTGIAIELPEGYEGHVRPRSGLAAKEGIQTCFGTIDNGYRGELAVTLFNLSFLGYRVRNGERIAQLVICPVAYPVLMEVSTLSETERGADGFGSTGV